MGGDSPRSRGWTVDGAVAAERPPGFPALAGMDLRVVPQREEHMRIPRARGDGPILLIRTTSSMADSPRSRGWTLSHPPRSRPVFGFPALAGMDPSSGNGSLGS